ncbi:MAG TPA: histidine kinase [Bacteroidales bacterium]|nr:histidine kinase [Bacteroidales bacterium]
MLTIVGLIVSIVLQFVAMIFAITLIRTTKYNSSWILLSIGLMVMAGRRLLDFLPYVNGKLSPRMEIFSSWLGVLVSLLMVVGVFYIRKIFIYLRKAEETRKVAEKRVLNAVILTEENERKRLAKDLHDGLGPLLATAKMSVSALTEQPGAVAENKTIYNNALQAINESIRSLREISNNLSPHLLDNFGLHGAISTFIEKINDTRKIKIEFTSNLGSQRFESNAEVILYRAVCELIMNTLKHAKANKILISLDREDDTLMLLYQDDGIGFEFQEILDGKTEGMGINNIRSRIGSLNGTFEVDSWPGEGIIVTIQVKIAP